jgi:outer membrane autotransporter protein
VRLETASWQTRGSSDGQRLGLQLGAGHPFAWGRFVVEPSGWLDWTELDLDGFEEEGAGALNLAVSQRRVSSLRSELGVRVSGRFALAGGRVPLIPELQVGWAREWLSNDPIEAALVGGGVSPFRVQSASSDGDTFVFRARSTAHLTERFSIFAAVTTELGGDDLQSSWLQLGAAFAF